MLHVTVHQFAGMMLLEEFFTINVLNQLSVCKMLLVLCTLIACMIYIGGMFFLNLCIGARLV